MPYRIQQAALQADQSLQQIIQIAQQLQQQEQQNVILAQQFQQAEQNAANQLRYIQNLAQQHLATHTHGQIGFGPQTMVQTGFVGGGQFGVGPQSMFQPGFAGTDPQQVRQNYPH
ncbi:hypothetical protein [Effusibacillus consociatus]|uniref:Uncharacterized protein n=1 Tax=Effusibacillus consociatus TaxID=1117041 RepID=A0ABV9PW73_9BACL